MSPPPATDLPGWIVDPVLAPAWQRLRERFEQTGLDARGTVVLPSPSREARHALGSLLGRTVTKPTVRVDVATLDARLRERSGIGGLGAVLTALHGAPPEDRAARRAAHAEARERPLALAAELVTAPWAADWIAGLRRTGLLTNRTDTERVITDAARILTILTDPSAPRATQSRVELGARLVGDAHALDSDRLLHQVVQRGLSAAAGVPVPTGAREKERLWSTYAVEPDLLSRTCLVWRLRGDEGTAVGQRLAAAAGDPIHLTEWDLRRLGRLAPAPDRKVLVCENPRILEALAEHQPSGWAGVCTSGEPNLVVDKVLALLTEAGADLRYHGDFDWPGIAIANRIVTRFSARPLCMGADDYLRGVLPEGPDLAGAPVEPIWSSELGAAMRHRGRTVHEESVLADVLKELTATGR